MNEEHKKEQRHKNFCRSELTELIALAPPISEFYAGCKLMSGIESKEIHGAINSIRREASAYIDKNMGDTPQ